MTPYGALYGRDAAVRSGLELITIDEPSPTLAEWHQHLQDLHALVFERCSAAAEKMKKAYDLNRADPPQYQVCQRNIFLFNEN